MLLRDFDFNLPEDLIATHPADPRDSANLLVADRKTGKIIHSHFYDLPNFLQKGDFLVFNSSKVIPARLFGQIGEKNVEVLLVKDDHGIWQAMARPGKRLRLGSEIQFSDGFSAEVVDVIEGVFRLKFNLSSDGFWREVERIGEMPLPPYILKARHEKHDERADVTDYQPIYADKPGSSAAPTAGLHFTSELMRKIEDKGCDIGFVDLHVGLGTFEPIRTKNIEDHKIHSEYFDLPVDLANKLNKAKKEGRRIIAVGTTTVRVLESCQENGILKPKSGETNIYIYPGYKFGFVDAMITNFHTPKSSLLLLVSAFWTREKVIGVYKEAIERGYRFYSYGDGMFIL
ncbi:MAG: tRNA preQ1(34) S-adenosylmethionine ribosyltransferase-isomerase QueA [bacterium]|nr:tRNA preQ1(34) S-adenosylmethionine ribosyltransferase-isomerase QueA [bacterium]